MSKQNLRTKGIEIKGYGHYFPKRVVTDQEVYANLEFKDAHPTEQTVMGEINVHGRHRSDEQETAVFMAGEASKMAMKDAGIDPSTVDLFIMGNWTERWLLHDLSHQAAIEAGIDNALAFDVGAACAGFILGIHTAVMYMMSGRYKRAVVVGSERFSIRTRPRSRGELITGDAAGAVVLENTGNRESGIIDTDFHSDGKLAYLISTPFPNGYIKNNPDLPKNAIEKSADAIQSLLWRNNLTIDDIDWVAPHPGTDVVLKGVIEKTKFKDHQYLANFHQRGNTSCASVPIVLSEYFHNGKIKKGDLILGTGVGAGWYWGGFLFRV
ncbi:MAG: ketoacyl-ACP synthase III [Leptospira sp.]|nr:ketoacyl-ACP synthase III [Leptospira sp.]